MCVSRRAYLKKHNNISYAMLEAEAVEKINKCVLYLINKLIRQFRIFDNRGNSDSRWQTQLPRYMYMLTVRVIAVHCWIKSNEYG